MKLNRTKNTIRNTGYGLINKLLIIVFPFIIRTVFIRTLGAEYLGLNSLFSSILTVLSLTELGFSSAIVFCMYKPIAEDDKKTIEALLYFYKKVYRYVGIIISILGCLIIPILPLLIKGKYPTDINIVIVYIVFLFNTVISYFLFAYLSALISAFQREDLISRVNIVVQSLMYIIQIVILLTIKDYYIYILTMPVFTIINNIRTAIIARKVFPEYKPQGILNDEYKRTIKEKITGLVISKVCTISRNALDSIFISMFLGLTETAIYNNYYYIINALIMLTSVFITSVVSGVGNSIEMDTVQKNYEDMERINFIYMWMAGWMTCCLLCLYQPFMFMWVGKDLMYPIGCVILLCLYFYILKMSDVRYIYELAIGLWWENRFRSIAEAVANLILNYVLGKFFGVYGIIIATIISILFINYFYGTRILFKYYYKEQSIKKYFGTQFVYSFITLIGCICTYWACKYIPYTFLGFCLRIMICIIVPNMLYYFVYKRNGKYEIMKKWLLPKLKGLKMSG